MINVIITVGADYMFMWIIFFSVILTLIIVDLFIFHKQDNEISFRESMWASAFYISISLIFGLLIWYTKGIDSFAEYVNGFFVEKSLALDNIFLISLTLSSLSIDSKYQHRVLFYGLLGAIIFRAIMIGFGAHIIAKFEWVLYIFSICIIITGIKILFTSHDKHVDMSQNILFIWMHKHLNITKQLHGNNFYIFQIDQQSQKKRLFFTPLFVSLVIIEFIDLIFAIDSIPAIFTITQDTYIVYTSNIFAILGLRALYFVLASIIKKFYYLNHSLAIILTFIGSKIFIVDLGINISPILSSMITVVILLIGIMCSLIKGRMEIKQIAQE